MVGIDHSGQRLDINIQVSQEVVYGGINDVTRRNFEPIKTDTTRATDPWTINFYTTLHKNFESFLENSQNAEARTTFARYMHQIIEKTDFLLGRRVKFNMRGAEWMSDGTYLVNGYATFADIPDPNVPEQQLMTLKGSKVTGEKYFKICLHWEDRSVDILDITIDIDEPFGRWDQLLKIYIKGERIEGQVNTGPPASMRALCLHCGLPIQSKHAHF